MGLVAQEGAQPLDAVVRRQVGEVDPEDVVEDGVVRLPDVFTSLINRALCRPRLRGMST